MPKKLVEITGFTELQAKIKKLSNDKDKRRPIIAILRKSAKSTITAARALAPKGSGYVDKADGSFWARKNRRVFKPSKGVIPYKAGAGKKSIKFQVLKLARNPMGVVGPRSLGKDDGFYLRQFVIPGHAGKKKVAPNFFMNRAQDATQNLVIGKAIPQTERFIQKQIDKL